MKSQAQFGEIGGFLASQTCLTNNMEDRSGEAGLNLYVPGPLTHKAQLLSGAAPLPKFAIAVKDI